MKFNWGTGIFLFYGIFVAGLFYQVLKSTHYDHSLVVDNYYEEDLAYQNRYEELANSAALKQKLDIRYLENEEVVRLAFPKDLGAIKGTIHFYRANNKDQDFSVSVLPNDEQVMDILDKAFPSAGRWTIEVSWEAAGKQFYDEQAVDISELEAMKK